MAESVFSGGGTDPLRPWTAWSDDELASDAHPGLRGQGAIADPRRQGVSEPMATEPDRTR
jgi:hypothetical protein